jgi:hypothetical protein
VTTRALAGNGILLVRERSMAAAVQRALERVYQLDRVVDVNAFVQPAQEGEREALLVRESDDGTVEMALRLPLLGQRELDIGDRDLDPLCQIIEGVSHFVYLTGRAEGGRAATQLEMELQAEVDKYVVLAGALVSSQSSSPRAFGLRSSARLRKRLYEAVSFEHAEGTELGDRYRIANHLAARFVWSLERRYLASGRFAEMRGELRRFYRMGQEEKLRVGRAA